MDQKYRVLVVEDNNHLNEIYRRVMEMEGYEVYTAFTLEEARQRLGGTEPDIILLGVILPDGSGIDFCREIRASVSAFIIFLSSLSDFEYEFKCLEAGGDDFLLKPFSIDLLRSRVARCIQCLQRGS